MKNPIIGITLDYENNGGYSKFPWYAIRENYLNCLYKFGAIPFPLFHNIEVNNQSWFTKGLKKFSNFDVNMEVDRFHLNNSSLQSELISTATQVLNNELM